MNGYNKAPFDHEKFLSGISVNLKTGCWDWSRCTQFGYGLSSIKGGVFKAHRMSYALFVGDIKLKYVIDHMCRNKKCVNPDHLQEISSKDNALTHRQDISWDCYDKNNWKAMLDSLIEIEESILNVEEINRLQELIEYRKLGDSLTELEWKALSNLENKLGDILGSINNDKNN